MILSVAQIIYNETKSQIPIMVIKVSIMLHTETITFNPLKTKRRPLYLKTQSVPRC